MSTSDYSIVTKTFMQIAKKTRWLKDTVPASCSGGHEIESGLGKETYMSGQFLVQYKVQQRLECYMFNIYNYTLVKKNSCAVFFWKVKTNFPKTFDFFKHNY